MKPRVAVLWTCIGLMGYALGLTAGAVTPDLARYPISGISVAGLATFAETIRQSFPGDTRIPGNASRRDRFSSRSS